MRLVWCLSVVGLVGAARITNDLYYNTQAQHREVDVLPFTFHMPGSVYNVPNPQAAPPQTPASTVLLPMIGQAPFVNDGAHREEEDIAQATAYIKPFDKCAKLFKLCTGIDIYDVYDPKKARSSGIAAADVTPGYLRYGGYGPVPSDQYPVLGHPVPSDQYPVHGHPGPVATPYIIPGRFWCGLYAWNCFPDMKKLKDYIKNTGGLPVTILG